MQNFNKENVKQGEYLKDEGTDGRKAVKWILQE